MKEMKEEGGTTEADLAKRIMSHLAHALNEICQAEQIINTLMLPTPLLSPVNTGKDLGQK